MTKTLEPQVEVKKKNRSGVKTPGVATLLSISLGRAKNGWSCDLSQHSRVNFARKCILRAGSPTTAEHKNNEQINLQE